MSRDNFLWLSLFAVLGIYVITLFGSVYTTRSCTPSISVMIDDEPTLRLFYGLFIGFLTVSRSGLVYSSTFYELEDAGWWSNVIAPYLAFACGSLQLVCFSLVGMFSVVLDPWYHYASALGTVLFGLICESILLWRRGKSKEESYTDWVYAANIVCLLGTYVSLLTFGILTRVDTYHELKTNMALSEWFGYYLVAYINLFRWYDVKIHTLQQTAKSVSLHVVREEAEGGWFRKVAHNA